MTANTDRTTVDDKKETSPSAAASDGRSSSSESCRGYCPQCGYPTGTGLCPECGRLLGSGDLLSKPRRRLNRAAKLTMLSILLAVLISVGYVGIAHFDWTPHLPLSVLLRLRDSGSESATNEIESRLMRKELSSEQLSDVLKSAFTTNLSVRSPCAVDTPVVCELTTVLALPSFGPDQDGRIRNIVLTLDDEELDSSSYSAPEESVGLKSHFWRIKLAPIPVGRHRVRVSANLYLPRLAAFLPAGIDTDEILKVSQTGDFDVVARAADLIVKSHCEPDWPARYKESVSFQTTIIPREAAIWERGVHIRIFANRLPHPIAGEFLIRPAGTTEYQSAGNCYVEPGLWTVPELRWPFESYSPARYDFKIVPSAEVALSNLSPKSSEYYGCVIEKENVIVQPLPPIPHPSQRDDTQGV